MKSFDETYADNDFNQHLDKARKGWMAQVPQASQPDLNVEGLRGSLLGRLLGAFGGRRGTGSGS
jgi:hypothetical protein